MTPLTPIPPQKEQNLPEYYATVDLIKSEHLTAARRTIVDSEILQELEEEIEKDAEWLRGFLGAAQV